MAEAIHVANRLSETQNTTIQQQKIAINCPNKCCQEHEKAPAIKHRWEIGWGLLSRYESNDSKWHRHRLTEGQSGHGRIIRPGIDQKRIERANRDEDRKQAALVIQWAQLGEVGPNIRLAQRNWVGGTKQADPPREATLPVPRRLPLRLYEELVDHDKWW